MQFHSFVGALIDCFVAQGLLEETVFCQGGCSVPTSKCGGHTNRLFLNECDDRCRCSKSCGNRVVQGGLKVPLQVFWTGLRGWGLRTLSPIRKGTFVFEFVGEVVTNRELMQRRAMGKLGKCEAYTLALDADWRAEQTTTDETALCIDGTVFSNVSRFLNHR